MRLSGDKELTMSDDESQRRREGGMSLDLSPSSGKISLIEEIFALSREN